MAKKNNTLIYGTISLAVLIIAVIGIGFYGGNTETSETEDVTIMMPFVMNSEWCAFYTAINNGYYADEGLSVTMLYTSEGSFGSVKQVVSENVDFGYASGDSIIMARSKDLPIVAVYQNEHSDLFSVITKKDSPITKPSDLDGKTIAIPGPGSPPDIAAKAILKNSGVDYNNVNFVPVGAALIPTLLGGEADAIAGYIIHELILQGEGVDINVWYAKDYNANFAGCSIITNENTLKENPELIKKFVRASNKGFKYAMDNPEKVVDAYIKNFNPDAEKFRDIELEYWERLTNEVYQPDKYPLGQFNKDQWTMTQDTLFDLGIITKKTPISEMYTDEFVPK
ncbi:MAG: ABC transporter substrate-binding protein [Candidatus Aenigmarchaeota archaeon]|nr:ABC transporter substrate-binding protein [Candidatus Aenigmarchaeota archaeon]